DGVRHRPLAARPRGHVRPARGVRPPGPHPGPRGDPRGARAHRPPAPEGGVDGHRAIDPVRPAPRTPVAPAPPRRGRAPRGPGLAAHPQSGTGRLRVRRQARGAHRPRHPTRARPRSRGRPVVPRADQRGAPAGAAGGVVCLPRPLGAGRTLPALHTRDGAPARRAGEVGLVTAPSAPGPPAETPAPPRVLSTVELGVALVLLAVGAATSCVVAAAWLTMYVGPVPVPISVLAAGAWSLLLVRVAASWSDRPIVEAFSALVWILNLVAGGLGPGGGAAGPLGRRRPRVAAFPALVWIITLVAVDLGPGGDMPVPIGLRGLALLAVGGLIPLWIAFFGRSAGAADTHRR